MAWGAAAAGPAGSLPRKAVLPRETDGASAAALHKAARMRRAILLCTGNTIPYLRPSPLQRAANCKLAVTKRFTTHQEKGENGRRSAVFVRGGLDTFLANSQSAGLQ